MFLKAFLLSGVIVSIGFSEPPKDPKALAIYEHNKKWLSMYPGAFIATNIRGKDLQYAERREAALDLIRERHDHTAIPELTQALQENSFLSDQICIFFGELKARETLPVLKQVASDEKRPKVVRQRAEEAITAIQKP